jgi:nuclear cap-binding protein subunit 2
MGLDRQRKTPCGFCFVEYRSRLGAELAKRFVATARLDDRHLLVDWDVGFEAGRQFGRGKSGGQAREAHMPIDNDDRSEFADALAQTLQTMAAASSHLAHTEPGGRAGRGGCWRGSVCFDYDGLVVGGWR